MKKRILACLLILLVFIPSLVGCSLYNKDTNKINSAVAIKVGDEVITREDLQNAYTSYYNYGYGSIYNQSELMDFVVKSLVAQKVAIITAKQIINITQDDFDDILSSVLDALTSAINEREIAIFDKLKEEIPERLQDTSEETSQPYKPYESVIVTPITDLGVAITSEQRNNKIAEFISSFVQECKQFSTRLNAYNDYIAELVQVDLISGKHTDKDEAFKNKINSMIEYYEDQKYIDKLQEYVESQISISDDEILTKFNQLINIEKQTYAGNTFADSYEKSDSSSTFLYYGYINENEDGEPVENGYINIQHILIQFSDEVKAELSKLIGYGISEKEYRFHLGQQWIAAGGDNTKENAPLYCWFPETDEELNETVNYLSLEEWESYVSLRDSFISSLTTTYLDPETGEKVVDEFGNEKTKTLSEVLDEISNLINDAQKTDAQKAQEFRKLMFIYGSDDGMFNVGKTTEVLGYSLPADMSKFSDDIGNTGNAG